MSRLVSLALKDYQQGMLDALDTYLDMATLEECYQEAEEFYNFKVSQSKSDAVNSKKSNYCYNAWERVKSQLHIPIYKNRKGKASLSIWQDHVMVWTTISP